MRYVIDTDVLISHLKGIEKAVSFLQKYDGTWAISVISLAELLEGIYGQRKEKQMLADLKKFLSGVDILVVDQKTAANFARSRAELRRLGRLIDNFDLLIAATCLAYGLTLVTQNPKHFERVRGLDILTP